MINFKQLEGASIFESVPCETIAAMLKSIDIKTHDFCAGEVIVLEGEVLNYIGILLSGRAVAIKNGLSGEEVVVANLSENSVFADILSGSINFESPVTVSTVSDCKVLFINYNQLLYSPHPCAHIVLQNMIKTISLKYFSQAQRIELLMIKSVRQKLLTFLASEKEKQGCDSFFIPLDRRLLADFLGVERSALSRELSRMQKDGLLLYNKNHFQLLK